MEKADTDPVEPLMTPVEIAAINALSRLGQEWHESGDLLRSSPAGWISVIRGRAFVRHHAAAIKGGNDGKGRPNSGLA